MAAGFKNKHVGLIILFCEKSLCSQDVKKKHFHNVIDICRSSAHHKFWTCNLFTSLARTQNHNFQLGIASTTISGTHWRQCAIEGHRTWGLHGPYVGRLEVVAIENQGSPVGDKGPWVDAMLRLHQMGQPPQQRWKVQCCQHIWVDYMV